MSGTAGAAVEGGPPISEAEVAHSAWMDVLRRRLAEAIGKASVEVQLAQATLVGLVDDSVYDVELAEGRDGDDMAAFLESAARFLRAAGRLVPRDGSA
jgi:hypothetical protein